jgi:hypothetical protein
MGRAARAMRKVFSKVKVGIDVVDDGPVTNS